MKPRTGRRMLLALGALVALAIAQAALQAAPSRIDIEPETGLLKEPMQVFRSDNASNGKCVGTKDGIAPEGKECGGQVKVTFTVAEAGNYYFWGRARWKDDCGDSFYVKVDGGSKHVFGEQGTEGEWKWFKGPKFNLASGERTLYIMGREDGALLDKVIFIPEGSRYEPQGKSG